MSWIIFCDDIDLGVSIQYNCYREDVMKDSVKKLILLGGIFAIIASVYIVRNFTDKNDFHDKYEGYDLSQDVAGATRSGTYAGYLDAHEGAACPDDEILVDLFKYTKGEGVENKSTYEGFSDVLMTQEDSEVTWEVNVPKAGFYNIELEYYAVESKGVPVERAIYIDDELPFSNAGNLMFRRMWKDGGAIKEDNQGNQIRPKQVEEFGWQTSYCRDDRGYVVDPFKFYFNAGSNKLTLKGINEPMAIKALKIKSVQKLMTYSEYLQQTANKTAKGEGLNYLQKIEGEASVLRSDSSLYAKYDRGSATTSPYSVSKTILNYTGGEAWSKSGQWEEWEITVPEDGLYNITVKGRQGYTRGNLASRCLYIDGEIPFEEVRNIKFPFSNDWEMITLANDAGTPYNFYLTAGTHRLRLEAALGDMGAIINDIEDSTFRLNQVYRTILVFTGSSPDAYRDYHIERVYPEAIKAMDLEYKRLYKIVDDSVEVTGQKSDLIAPVQTLATLLEEFVDRPDKITVKFRSFKDDVTALGTTCLSLSECKLDIDYLVVTGTSAKVPKDSANFFQKSWHEIKSFVSSYFIDYNAVGDVYGDDEEVVKVWVLTGRDQGTILKSLIDDSFTPQTGIKVNVEVVQADVLLNAVLAGRGPNVVISVGANVPVDYALRGAAEDLTQFSDLQEALKPYSESSYEQYKFEDGLYAMPETSMFPVMFYRKDILDELGLEPPETWEDMIAMLPTIQSNNMTIGIPSAAGSNGVAAVGSMDLFGYFSLLYQNGGDLYNESGTKTIVDNEAGVAAFKDYVKYFNDYGLPTVYDFATWFRSGEMPIGITSYTLYNTLQVSAPEIRGLWDFTTIPGTKRVDENGNEYVDHTAFITGGATMMIKTKEQSLKDKSWEFMKWWASTDAQVNFGREMEALLGTSARYSTANREAVERLSWSASNVEQLNKQWNETKGVREVPGGYFTGRHITNAIRRIINFKEDPREAIMDYAIDINNELTKKRKEFNMPLE